MKALVPLPIRTLVMALVLYVLLFALGDLFGYALVGVGFVSVLGVLAWFTGLYGFGPGTLSSGWLGVGLVLAVVCLMLAFSEAYYVESKMVPTAQAVPFTRVDAAYLTLGTLTGSAKSDAGPSTPAMVATQLAQELVDLILMAVTVGSVASRLAAARTAR